MLSANNPAIYEGVEELATGSGTKRRIFLWQGTFDTTKQSEPRGWTDRTVPPAGLYPGDRNWNPLSPFAKIEMNRHNSRWRGSKGLTEKSYWLMFCKL